MEVRSSYGCRSSKRLFFNSLPDWTSKPESGPVSKLVMQWECSIFARRKLYGVNEKRESYSLFCFLGLMDDKAQMIEWLQPYLNNDQLYIVDVQVVGRQGGRIKVTILLDSDTGITIEECATISRRLGGQMDESNFFGESPFTLEVSSPGVDFPLTFTRQYVRNIGRQLTVTLVDEAIRKGRLESVADDHIVFDVEVEKLSKSKKKKEGLSVAEVPAGPTPIPFVQIKKANVDVSFK